MWLFTSWVPLSLHHAKQLTEDIWCWESLFFHRLQSSHKFFGSCNTVPHQTSRNHHFNKLSVASMKSILIWNIFFLSFVIKSVVLWICGDLQRSLSPWKTARSTIRFSKRHAQLVFFEYLKGRNFCGI